MPEFKKITANEMAALTETVHGTQDTDLCIVRTKEGDYRAVPKNKTKDGDEVILDVRTNSKQPTRSKLGITITDKSSGKTIELADCDSLFWTESAVEKFFWPYYHSQRLFDAGLQRLHEDYYKNTDILAIGHMPPTRPKKLLKPMAPADDVAVVLKGPRATEQFELMSLSEYLELR